MPRDTFLLATHFVWGAPTKPADGARGVLHKSQQNLPAVFELETKLAKRSERAESTNLTRDKPAWPFGGYDWFEPVVEVIAGTWSGQPKKL